MHHKFNKRITNQEIVACREAPVFDSYPELDNEIDPGLANYPSLTIIATPRSRFVYWKVSEPYELLDDAQLVACLRDLPNQEGRPLSPIEEEGVGDIGLAGRPLLQPKT